MRVRKMEPSDLKSISVDELWRLHELVNSVLAHRISAEKTRLDQQLRQLNQNAGPHKKRGHTRRPYPRVFPKFMNPAQPHETWAGRGKQPRWLTAHLRSGKQLDDFRIEPSSWPSEFARVPSFDQNP